MDRVAVVTTAHRVNHDSAIRDGVERHHRPTVATSPESLHHVEEVVARRHAFDQKCLPAIEPCLACRCGRPAKNLDTLPVRAVVPVLAAV